MTAPKLTFEKAVADPDVPVITKDDYIEFLEGLVNGYRARGAAAVNKMERDFLASPGEHLDVDCWCHHPASAHHPDPVRDYRELRCELCESDPRVVTAAEPEGETP